MMKLFSLALLFGLMATGVRADEHVVAPDETSFGFTTLAAFDARMEEAAEMYLQEYPSASIARIVLSDLAWPLDSTEYEAMGKNGVLLLSAVSHDSDELPLAAAYIGGVKLKYLGSVRRQTPSGSKTQAAFGDFRTDSFYLLPVDLARKGTTLSADFAKNRLGFTISQDAFAEPDFMKLDLNPKPDPNPARSAVKVIIDREYPGFGVEPFL